MIQYYTSRQNFYSSWGCILPDFLKQHIHFYFQKLSLYSVHGFVACFFHSSIYGEHSFISLDTTVRACVRAQSCSDSLPPHGLQPARLLCPWDSPSRNTGRGCHFLLQGIFLTQGLNLRLLHWKMNSLPLSHLESSRILLSSSFFRGLYWIVGQSLTQPNL